MEINILGLVAALATFLSVWWGHIGVRKIEAISVRLWAPILVAILLGLICEVIAAQTENINVSSAFGIIGIVFLWDAFEFYRQQNRVKKGHAPANPNNPRHAQILAEFPAATEMDWLDRNPRGYQYSKEEIVTMKESAK